MKVLLVNGSPHKKGCTYTALNIVRESLKKEDIEADIFWIENKPLTGCIGCGYCAKAGKCRYNDRVNEFLEIAKEYDGFVFGVPVHFASAAASMSAFMDRAFFVDHCANLFTFELKPAAVVTSARRAGTTATLDQMLKYPIYAQMPVVSSRYWNMVHGQTPEQVLEDERNKRNRKVMIFQKAKIEEFEHIKQFYWNLIDEMKDENDKIGWKKGIYPTDEFLIESLKKQQLFTLKEGNELYACVILNHDYNEGYKGILWSVKCQEEEILIPHALAVLPMKQGSGVGTKVVEEIITYARSQHKKAVRLDILGSNQAAERLYTKCGFYFVQAKEMFYEDTGWTEYKIYELNL